MIRLTRGMLCALLLVPAVARAQNAPNYAPPSASARVDLPPIDGPDAPIAPSMITRDDRGRATLRAVRIEAPLRLDGRLDDEIYARVPGVGDFIQQLPREGQPATEATEVWIFFDENNIYVAVRCLDSHPERMIANELRRDNRNIFSLNDSISVVLDTFYDRRNGYFFQTNPLGAIRDQAINDGAQNESWNTVWDVRADRSDRGYTVEMAIPFKSLRYRGSGPQVWGINVRRVVKWKNEVSNLTLVPASYGAAGITQMGKAATLLGLETPGQALNLEVKPYAVTSSTTDLAAKIPIRNDVKPNVGLDAKYGLTKGITADLTVNTDFAQVEEDQQQVNLTRFNLLFPEKRDFFLEGAGIFEFGGARTNLGTPSDVPVLFFSRRIGLSGSQSVPVTGGGRVTGKAGRFEVGALAVRTEEMPSAAAPATTFSALRLRRNVLRRSSIGAIATGRWPALNGADTNGSVGVDADLRFFTNIQATAYWARTSSPGRAGDQGSYRAQFVYDGDRYGFGADRVTVQRDFNPEVGFMRRSDFSSNGVNARFSPRPKRSRVVRQYTLTGSLEYVTNAARTSLEDRTLDAGLSVEFHSSDQISVKLTQTHEVLPSKFAISPGVVLPAADYDYNFVNASYTLGQQRPVSGTVSASRGSFYDGMRTTAGYNGRIGFSPRFAMEPTLTLNWVTLPQGDFTARLAGTRFVVTPSPRLGFSSLVQFNASSHSLTASARMRWEYIPGSELFVVYSDGRDTAVSGFPGLLNRSFAVKVTRLLRL